MRRCKTQHHCGQRACDQASMRNDSRSGPAQIRIHKPTRSHKMCTRGLLGADHLARSVWTLEHRPNRQSNPTRKAFLRQKPPSGCPAQPCHFCHPPLTRERKLHNTTQMSSWSWCRQGQGSSPPTATVAGTGKYASQMGTYTQASAAQGKWQEHVPLLEDSLGVSQLLPKYRCQRFSRFLRWSLPQAICHPARM